MRHVLRSRAASDRPRDWRARLLLFRSLGTQNARHRQADAIGAKGTPGGLLKKAPADITYSDHDDGKLNLTDFRLAWVADTNA
jgi:hypothetical protein